jgi:hypothetical protein
MDENETYHLTEMENNVEELIKNLKKRDIEVFDTRTKY